MPDGQRSRLYDSQCLHDAMEHSWIFVGLQISPERSNAREENLHHQFYQNSTDVDSWWGSDIVTVLPGATMHSCLFEGANNSSTKNDPKKVQHLYIDRYIVQSSNESFFLSNEKFTCVGCFVWEDILFLSFCYVKTWGFEAPICDKGERTQVNNTVFFNTLTHTSAR